MSRAWVVAFALLASCGGAQKSAGGANTSESMKETDAEKTEPAFEPVEVRTRRALTDLDEAEKAFAAAGGDCAQLCRALDSMRRATERLCALSKESGEPERCDDATAKLAAATAKVKSSCGGCG